MGAQRKNENEDISSKIQKSLISCCQKRKKQNKQQKLAYIEIVKYFRRRYQDQKEIPGDMQIKIIQIFIKLVKSGWIIGVDELKFLLLKTDCY